MTDPRPPSVPLPESPGPDVPRKHILVIDDELPILDLLQEYLKGHGYRVSIANTALAAKRLAQAEKPHLIISDLQLEDTDGLHLVEQLRASHTSAPVILLTGVLFDPQVVEEKLTAKISSYVSKTAPLQTLLREVRRLIGS